MITDGGYLEIEIVLDQADLIEGDHTHAVLHDDVSYVPMTPSGRSTESR
ncbi:hypothetical protein OG252_01700 [Streptomyces sp. NBC_01352]|nr:hypothetical protein [Streptomyces sp. NBC_01352]